MLSASIFASWENEVIDQLNFVSSSNFNGSNRLGPKKGEYPNDLSNAYRVERMAINPIISQDSETAPETKQVNAYVYTQIKQTNPSSVWQ